LAWREALVVASEAQIAANRRNAQRSTGPTTDVGKAKVSQNALKHGLLTGRKLVPGEDPAEFAELEKTLLETLKPMGAVEAILVERIVDTVFRLRRVGRVESGLFSYRIHDLRARIAAGKVYRYSESTDSLMASILDERRPTNKESYEAARAEKLAEEECKQEELPTLGQAFFEDQKGFSTLSRYEATLERGLYKALHELERMQRSRAGEEVPPPLAVDVDVTATRVEPLDERPSANAIGQSA
jgi:hypothetical protein